jgi:3-hydroxyacyl-CoA dehydrogenase
VKHAAFVERVWFEVSLLGATRESLGLPAAPDASFDLVATDTVASVRADFLAAVARSRVIAASYGLDDLVLHNRRSPLTLRWVYAHLIREFARHAGHADILRELIDGATGR